MPLAPSVEVVVAESSYLRIVADLRSFAASSPPGTRLPANRELVERYRASPVTIQQATSALVREGLVVARPGRGTFVAQDRDPVGRGSDSGWQALPLGSAMPLTEGLEQLVTLARPGTVSLSSGYLDEQLQPRALLGAALARAGRRPGAWGRLPIEGLEELRALFAAEVGDGLRAHNVLITSGGQASLSASFRALTRPGQAVVVESPTYVGAIAAAHASGLRLIPVPTDAEGVRPDLLAEAVKGSGARLIYCQPRYANPTGSLMSPERRQELMEVATSAGAFVIEDDWVMGLDLEGPSPPPLASDDPDGHVIYLRSLTKSLAPGLRVGALIARGPVLSRLRSLRAVDDFFVAPSLQETALQVIGSPAWPKHLKGVIRELRIRRDALSAAVVRLWPDAETFLIPKGGLHMWVRIPDGLNDVHFAEEAALSGVSINPGRDWFPADPVGSYLRLSYAGADASALTQAVAQLAVLLRTAASVAR